MKPGVPKYIMLPGPKFILNRDHYTVEEIRANWDTIKLRTNEPSRPEFPCRDRMQ